MKGCDRCGHRKKDHLRVSIASVRCIVIVGTRACLCPGYLKPGTMA